MQFLTCSMLKPCKTFYHKGRKLCSILSKHRLARVLTKQNTLPKRLSSPVPSNFLESVKNLSSHSASYDQRDQNLWANNVPFLKYCGPIQYHWQEQSTLLKDFPVDQNR